MSNKAVSVYAEALKRKQIEEKQNPTQTTTQLTTWERKASSDLPRNLSRDGSRELLREYPTRDEIQEFSFHLRDELKVKVQAEVPHQWQKELEQVARQLNVKKLELYRFILGEFLGKVKNQKPG